MPPGETPENRNPPKQTSGITSIPGLMLLDENITSIPNWAKNQMRKISGTSLRLGPNSRVPTSSPSRGSCAWAHVVLWVHGLACACGSRGLVAQMGLWSCGRMGSWLVGARGARGLVARVGSWARLVTHTHRKLPCASEGFLCSLCQRFHVLPCARHLMTSRKKGCSR